MSSVSELIRSFEKQMVADDEVNVVGCGWLQKTIVLLVLRLDRQKTVDPMGKNRIVYCDQEKRQLVSDH